ncbi:hypothetical protein B0H16DRAFT_1470286 [Mycena metata]|uniref:Uncharacterized protein n=1 Tax=Mycena metata TaxID=1033252 RepID=A0AAD7MRK8_9AGAR|nr:hypothetical protein B0H16DRAFT_1470286 [Mycena metata]
MPNATNLATAAVDDYIFVRLTPERFRGEGAGTWPVILPKLRCLTATGLPASDAFVHMIESRVVATNETVGWESVFLYETAVAKKHEAAYARLQDLTVTDDPVVAIHRSVFSVGRTGAWSGNVKREYSLSIDVGRNVTKARSEEGHIDPLPHGLCDL